MVILNKLVVVVVVELKNMEFFVGEALVFTKFLTIFFRGRTRIVWNSSGVNTVVANL